MGIPAHKNTVEGKLDLLIKKEEERNRYLKALCKLKEVEIHMKLMKEAGILNYDKRNFLIKIMRATLDEALINTDSKNKEEDFKNA